MLYMGSTVRQKKMWRAMGLHALRCAPPACASIFHISLCFENVYARVPAE